MTTAARELLEKFAGRGAACTLRCADRRGHGMYACTLFDFMLNWTLLLLGWFPRGLKRSYVMNSHPRNASPTSPPPTGAVPLASHSPTRLTAPTYRF